MQEPLETGVKNKTIKIKSWLLTIGIGTLILIIFIIPFLQVFFPVQSQPVIKASNAFEKVDDLRSETESKLKAILYDYQQKKISDNQVLNEINKYTPLIKTLESESEVLYSILVKQKEQDKVFGFRTSKVFFANLGMPLVSVFLGVFLLFLFYKEEDYFFRKIILAYAFVGVITGLFYVVWVFYPMGDLPESTYILMQLSFSITGALVAFVAGKYFYAMSQIDLKVKIQNLLGFITRDVKKKYISTKDQGEYISDYLGEIEKLSKK